jgi:hypothetical protein
LRFGDAGQRVDHLGDDLLGVEWATSSMSMPPSLEAIRATFCVARSVTSDTYSSFLMSAPSSMYRRADLLAFGAGLVRHQLHAQDLLGQLLHVVDGLGHLHAAALAAATSVDLGLHHPHGAAQLLGCFNSLLHGERRNAAGNGHTKLAQDFLALVFMNLHDFVSLNGGNTRLPWTRGQAAGLV